MMKKLQFPENMQNCEITKKREQLSVVQECSEICNSFAMLTGQYVKTNSQPTVLDYKFVTVKLTYISNKSTDDTFLTFILCYISCYISMNAWRNLIKMISVDNYEDIKIIHKWRSKIGESRNGTVKNDRCSNGQELNKYIFLSPVQTVVLVK
jgi:hypothetical protein